MELQNAYSCVPTKDSIPGAAAYVEGVMDANDVSMKIASKVNIALDEMYSNVVNYSGASRAQIACTVADGVLTLIIADDGVPYNPDQKEDPDVTASLEEREIGGLGIFLTKKLMDEVSYRYEDGQNVLTIKKKLG